MSLLGTRDAAIDSTQAELREAGQPVGLGGSDAGRAEAVEDRWIRLAGEASLMTERMTEIEAVRHENGAPTGQPPRTDHRSRWLEHLHDDALPVEQHQRWLDRLEECWQTALSGQPVDQDPKAAQSSVVRPTRPVDGRLSRAA